VTRFQQSNPRRGPRPPGNRRPHRSGLEPAAPGAL